MFIELLLMGCYLEGYGALVCTWATRTSGGLGRGYLGGEDFWRTGTWVPGQRGLLADWDVGTWAARTSGGLGIGYLGSEDFWRPGNWVPGRRGLLAAWDVGTWAARTSGGLGRGFEFSRLGKGISCRSYTKDKSRKANIQGSQSNLRCAAR